MVDIPLMNPTVGIERRLTFERNELPERSVTHQTVPSPVPSNTEEMYAHREISDVARTLMTPSTPDQSLLLRAFYSPKLRGAIKKATAQINAQPNASDADRQTAQLLKELDDAQKALMGNMQQLTRA